jgi:hypothetical protein
VPVDCRSRRIFLDEDLDQFLRFDLRELRGSLANAG